MFGMSGVEFAFCAVLALLVIGPKDLPKVARTFGRIAGSMRRIYRDVLGSMTQLEREIERVDGPERAEMSWQSFLPPEVKELRASIKPHTNREETAEKYKQVKQAVAKAKADYAAHVQAASQRPAVTHGGPET
jgi:sec-independent protein translocase protein TatB